MENSLKSEILRDELGAIEAETGNEDLLSDVPFNPNDININIIPRTIGQIVEMLEYDEILIPGYQRLPNLWDIRKKSRFIESLMLNLPIPLFYFDEGDDKKWRVIDGLQRISTLEHFILAGKKEHSNISSYTEPFRLQSLEFRSEYNGKLWSELPREVKRRINISQVTINLIGKGTPEQVKYNIFSRINQGSVQLAAQEIRTALYQGYRVNFLESLVSEANTSGRAFLNATGGSIPKTRQQDLDFATRFVTFFLLDTSTYEPDMDSFLTTGTKNIPDSGIRLNSIATAFENAMSLSYDLLGSHSFRKVANFNDRRRPINKSLFEVVSVQFARCSDEQRNMLINNKDRFLNQYIELLSDEKFVDAITTGTATKERVKQRHDDFSKLLSKFFHDSQTRNSEFQIS